jgi:hypothetical protein
MFFPLVPARFVTTSVTKSVVCALWGLTNPTAPRLPGKKSAGGYRAVENYVGSTVSVRQALSKTNPPDSTTERPSRSTASSRISLDGGDRFCVRGRLDSFRPPERYRISPFSLPLGARKKRNGTCSHSCRKHIRGAIQSEHLYGYPRC